MTFTAEDNGDGTVTLSVTLGTPAAVLTLSCTKISFQDGSTAWASFGSITLDGLGAGTRSQAAAEDVWVFGATSGGIMLSPAARCDVGAVGGAVVTRTRRAIAARILTLSLGVTVEQHWTNDETNLEFPCVVLSPGEGMGETDENGMSLTDDVGYPVLVEIFDRCDVLDHESLPAWEQWRQSIIRAFRNRPLDAVREIINCRIEYGPIVENNLPKYQFLMSRFLIRAIAREHRTT